MCQSGGEEKESVTLRVFLSVNQVPFSPRQIHPISLTRAQPVDQMRGAAAWALCYGNKLDRYHTDRALCCISQGASTGSSETTVRKTVVFTVLVFPPSGGLAMFTRILLVVSTNMQPYLPIATK